jgi:eukaryotic-like serine/threonine-protein kinase
VPTVEDFDREARARLEQALGPTYELRELLGRGGFGDVYAAWDVRLKREVAIKALRADLVVTGGMLERFRREAEAAAGLRHPHIVPIYAVGEEGNVAWFAMPLVKGDSLRTVMEREGPFAPAEARRILREAASALAAAHAAGIIHRDIKPDNIMLEGPERRVLLMDFGIAKAVAEAEHGLTGSGFILGTPQYMSPEQAAGERIIDGRSDLYSLGVVGYQMLAGKAPFEGTSPGALIVGHVTQPPPPLQEVRPDLPAPLASTVMRCLAKQPADRWDSAEQLVRALDADVVVTPSAATVPYAPPRRPPSRSTLVAGGVLAFAVAAFFGGRALLAPRPAGGTAVPSVAVLYFDNLSGDSADLYLAQGLTDELTARLGSVERLRVKSLNAVRRVQQTAAAEDLAGLGRALGVDYLVEGSVRRAASRVRVTVSLVQAQDGFRVWGAQLDGSTMDILALQDSIAGNVAASIRGRLLPAEQASLRARPTQNAMAYDHFLRGNHALARRGPRALEEAVAEYDAAVRLDPDFTQALARVSLAYALALWWDWPIGGMPAESLLERGLAATDRILARNSAVADAWTARGFLLTFRHPRTYEGVEEAFQRSLALDSANFETWQQYAWILTTTGRDSACVAAYRRALALEPDLPIAYWGLAWTSYIGFNRRAEAMALLDSGVAIDSTAYYLYTTRAQLRLLLGDSAGADADAAAALRHSPPGFTLAAEASQAYVDAALGRRAVARARIERVLRQAPSRNQTGFLEGFFLAPALVLLGERDRALEVLEGVTPLGASLHFHLRVPGLAPLRGDPRFERLLEASRPAGVSG